MVDYSILALTDTRPVLSTPRLSVPEGFNKANILKRLFTPFRLTEVTPPLYPNELCPEKPNQFHELVFKFEKFEGTLVLYHSVLSLET